MSDGAALKLDGVAAGYGDTVVLEAFDLALAAGERASIIGRNGVGKSTLLATIIGLATLHGGRIELDGADISRTPVYRRSASGIGYVPQEREVFPSLTVSENLLVAQRKGRWDMAGVFDLFPRLAERATNRGNQLSGGEQQMLAVARALMGNPRLLLLDEPSEGLAPVIVEQLMEALTRLARDSGMSILMVEQNIDAALAFADRTIVMLDGRIAFDGASDSLRQDQATLDRLVGVGATEV